MYCTKIAHRLVLLLLFIQCVIYENASGKRLVRVRRVVGGDLANQADWQFIVSVQRYKVHYCGGVLISPFHVLTAATYAVEVKNEVNIMSVVAGTADLNDLSNAAVRQLESIEIAEDYDNKGIANNLAVLHLAKPIYTDKTPSAKAISIVSGENLPTPWCRLAGWGSTEFVDISSSPSIRKFGDFSQLFRTSFFRDHSSKYQTKLREIRWVEIVQTKTCQKKLNALVDFTIPSTVVCYVVQKDLKDVCFGDYGGPVVCDDTLGGKELD